MGAICIPECIKVDNENLLLHVEKKGAHSTEHVAGKFGEVDVRVSSVSLDFGEVAPEEVACTVLGCRVDAIHPPASFFE